MAQINPALNVGTDSAITISDDFGDVFPAEALAHLMEFDAESEDVEIKIVPITGGGVPIHMTIWSGIRGHMMFTRYGGAFQAMITELMDAYFDEGRISYFTITQSVLNRDGTIDEYFYESCQWNRPHFGNFRATKEVDMRVEFRSARCRVTGGATSFLSL